MRINKEMVEVPRQAKKCKQMSEAKEQLHSRLTQKIRKLDHPSNSLHFMENMQH